MRDENHRLIEDLLVNRLREEAKLVRRLDRQVSLADGSMFFFKDLRKVLDKIDSTNTTFIHAEKGTKVFWHYIGSKAEIQTVFQVNQFRNLKVECQERESCQKVNKVEEDGNT